VPEIEASTDADLVTLRERIPWKKLAPQHPIRRWWTSPTSDARFELHHLADDLRIVDGLNGSVSLMKQVFSSPETFPDFRYELRMAGTLGRPGGQQLTRLGGDGPGPDIEFISNSGHRCGVACFSARTVSPSTEAAAAVAAKLAKGFLPSFAHNPIDQDVMIEIIFDDVPVHEDCAKAQKVLEKLWRRHDVPELGADGVRVRRLRLLEPVTPAFNGRPGAQLRFLFPIPARENHRIGRTLHEKLFRETHVWAGRFSGIPLLAAEDSDFGHGLSEETVAALLADPQHSFALLLFTQAFFPENDDGICHRMERVRFLPRQSAIDLGLNIGMETLGNNLVSWSDEEGMLSFHPDHAEERWEISWHAAGVGARRVKPLNLATDYTKIEHPKIPRPGDDPQFVENLKEALNGLLARRQR